MGWVLYPRSVGAIPQIGGSYTPRWCVLYPKTVCAIPHLVEAIPHTIKVKKYIYDMEKSNLLIFKKLNANIDHH